MKATLCSVAFTVVSRRCDAVKTPSPCQTARRWIIHVAAAKPDTFHVLTRLLTLRFPDRQWKKKHIHSEHVVLTHIGAKKGVDAAQQYTLTHSDKRRLTPSHAILQRSHALSSAVDESVGMKVWFILVISIRSAGPWEGSAIKSGLWLGLFNTVSVKWLKVNGTLTQSDRNCSCSWSNCLKLDGDTAATLLRIKDVSFTWEKQ